jgi:F0F1-type ATP synthase membrane subunit b/b'
MEEQISSVAENAQAQASELVQPLKDNAERIAEQQKEAGAEQVGSVARAVHGAAGELEKELPQAARYIHDRLDRASLALRERSVDDLVHSLSDFARKQPATFFGSAVFAGFVLSRFLKSTAPKQS